MKTIKEINANRNILMLHGEIWKDIDEFNGIYQVSNFGRIKSLSRVIFKGRQKTLIQLPEIIMKIQVSKTGYAYVTLTKSQKTKRIRVNRCVAKAFIHNDQNLSDVDHINGDKLDNNVTNLQWLSNEANRKKQDAIQKHKESVEIAKRKYSKPIIMYDLSGKFMQKFDCRSDAVNATGISVSCIKDCLRHKVYQTHGYIFRYIDDNTIVDIVKKQTFKKPIVQLSIDNKEVSRYDTISEAVKKLNLGKGAVSKISACCKGLRQTIYGYKWIFQ